MEKNSFPRPLSQLLQPGPKEWNVSPTGLSQSPESPCEARAQSLVAACTWGVLVGTAGAGGCSRGLQLCQPGSSSVLVPPVGCPAASAHLLMATGRLGCLVNNW